MLLIVGAVIVSIVVVVIHNSRAYAEVNGLGWMSERWLAEHRASHSA